MAQNQIVKIKGLHTYYNDLDKDIVPEGSLFIAQNAVISKNSIVEPRRGFTNLDYKLPDENYRAERFFSFKDTLLTRYNSSSLAYYVSSSTSFSGDISTATAAVTNITSTANLVAGMTVFGNGIADDTFITAVSSSQITLSKVPTSIDTGVTLAAAGFAQITSWTFSDPASGVKSRAQEANSNFYVTTNDGVKKLDGVVNSTAVDSGAPRALEVSASLGSSGGGFLSSNGVVAYRAVWGYVDSNENVILGAPSQRTLITNNTTSSQDVKLQVVIPSEVNVDYFYQIYRSSPISAATNEQPNDELSIVYESNPSAGEITAGITNVFTDQVPESLRLLNTSLYTNPSQEGILQANNQPPYAQDLALFKGSLFYANTKTKQNLTINLVAAGGESGLQHRGFYASITSGSSVISSVTAFTGIVTGMLVDSTVFSTTGTVASIDTSAGTITVSGASATSSNSSAAFIFRDQITIAGTTYSTQFGSSEYTGVSKNPGSSTISSISSTAELEIGMIVTGSGIPQNTTITAISTSTSIVVSNNPTLNSSGGSIVITEAELQISNGKFGVFTAGTPAQNIGDTAKDLIKVINRFSSNSSVKAYYLSGFDDLPGQILIEEEDINGSAFTATAASHGAAFDPTLPTSGNSVSSTNDEFKNAVYFSKSQEPEAVPTLNFFRVGSADEQILRIIPLRDSMFIFKEDGVYRLTGEDPTNFRVDPFDLTVKLKGRETARPLDNLIYFLSEQGISWLSEANAEAVSRPIEDKILELFPFSNLEEQAFAISYESERQYILFLPTASTDITPTQAFVYNVSTEAWTQWILTKSAGFVDPVTDKIILADANSNQVNVERKQRSFRDYVEEEFDGLTITSIDTSGTGITLSSFGDSGVAVGDILYQDTGTFGTVAAVNTDTNTLTIQAAGPNWLANFSSAKTATTLSGSAAISAISSTSDLRVGMSVSGTGIPANATIQSIDTSTGITLSDNATASGTNSLTFQATGAVSVLKSIPVIIEFTSQFADNPGINKHFRDVSFFFNELSFYNIESSFSTNLDRSRDKVTLTETGVGLWGYFPWGESPWGGEPKRGTLLRTYIPKQKQYASQIRVRLTQNEGYAFFELSGMNIMYNPVSGRTRR